MKEPLMTTITTMLLDFLLGLLRDPEAAAAFREDPMGALEDAGLAGVTDDDVDAVMPVVMDVCTINSSFDREYIAGGNGAVWGHGNDHDHDHDHDNDHGHGDEDHGHAVQQLTHIV